MINTATNEPEILKTEEAGVGPPHGTRVELEMEGSYIPEPEAIDLRLSEERGDSEPPRPDHPGGAGRTSGSSRGATDKMPSPSYEIKPHPWGMELGGAIKMLRYTDKKKLKSAANHFQRRGYNISRDLRPGGARPRDDAPRPDPLQATRLLAAFKEMRLKSPPTDCLSPIGEELIRAGLERSTGSTSSPPPEAGLGLRRKPLPGGGGARLRRRAEG